MSGFLGFDGISSTLPPSSSPVPVLMARAMVAFGVFTALASAIASLSRGFMSESPPPNFAATIIALEHLLQALPRLLSITALLCLIPAQCECPAMLPFLLAASSITEQVDTLGSGKNRSPRGMDSQSVLRRALPDRCSARPTED